MSLIGGTRTGSDAVPSAFMAARYILYNLPASIARGSTVVAPGYAARVEKVAADWGLRSNVLISGEVTYISHRTWMSERFK